MSDFFTDEDDARLRVELARAMKDAIGSGYVDDYYYSLSADTYLVATKLADVSYHRGFEAGKHAVSEAPTLRVGDTLHGYCEGYFGRDSYGTKTVIHVGPDYVVVRESDGTVMSANIDPARLAKYTAEEEPDYGD